MIRFFEFAAEGKMDKENNSLLLQFQACMRIIVKKGTSFALLFTQRGQHLADHPLCSTPLWVHNYLDQLSTTWW